MTGIDPGVAPWMVFDAELAAVCIFPRSPLAPAAVRSALALTPRSIWRDMTKSAGMIASRVGGGDPPGAGLAADRWRAAGLGVPATLATGISGRLRRRRRRAGAFI
jgi:hypothetical protein